MENGHFWQNLVVGPIFEELENLIKIKIDHNQFKLDKNMYMYQIKKLNETLSSS